LKAIASVALNTGADDELPGLGPPHEAGGEVDLVPEDAVGAARGAAVGAGERGAAVEAALGGGDEVEGGGRCSEGKGGGQRQGALSFVGEGAPKAAWR
jgi:hypothetical protein